MTRISNEFISELPELKTDIDNISQEWIDKHKPLKRFGVLEHEPSDPILNNLVSKFNKELFHERFVFMLIRFGPYETYEPHIDASRNTGINIVIRGDRDKSPIKYYNENNLIDPVFTYHYKDYPIVMTSQKYHSIFNDSPIERVLFTIHLKSTITYEMIKTNLESPTQTLFI